MGKNSHTIKLGISILACLCLVWSCTQKAEFVNPPTKLKIQVFKEGGIPLKNARVGIFSDSVVYNVAKGTYGISTADFDDTTDSQGFVYFDSVSSDVRYYVLCKYDSITKNSTGVRDTIAWSNIRADYQFLNPLKPNTVTTAQVYIAPSDGFVNFWTTNVYVNRQPINIKIGLISDTLKQIGLALGRKIKIRAGIHKYQARSPYGCVWIGSVDVKAGETINEELQVCTMVPVTIGVTSATSRQLGYSIKVVLNGTDTLRESITQYMFANTTGQVPCGAANTISVVRPSGTYSYQMIGSNGTVAIGTTTFEAPAQNQKCDTLIVNYK